MGGLAIQSGSVLHCFVGQPTRNTVQVIDYESGAVEMSWNFGSPQTFEGVTTTTIEAQRARTDQFTFQLTHGDTVTAVAAAAGTTFQQPGRSAGPIDIELSPHRPADSMRARAAGAPLAHFHNVHGRLTVQTDPELTVAANAAKPEQRAKQDDGVVVQTGSELTVNVNRTTTNVVEMSADDFMKFQVEWNGGVVHSFTGVTTIVVNTRNARTDRVTLTDTSA
jgi:hypothetical protein